MMKHLVIMQDSESCSVAEVPHVIKKFNSTPFEITFAKAEQTDRQTDKDLKGQPQTDRQAEIDLEGHPRKVKCPPYKGNIGLRPTALLGLRPTISG